MNIVVSVTYIISPLYCNILFHLDRVRGTRFWTRFIHLLNWFWLVRIIFIQPISQSFTMYYFRSHRGRKTFWNGQNCYWKVGRGQTRQIQWSLRTRWNQSEKKWRKRLSKNTAPRWKSLQLTANHWSTCWPCLQRTTSNMHLKSLKSLKRIYNRFI